MKNYNGKYHLLVVGTVITILSAGISFGQLQASLGTGVQANLPHNPDGTPPQQMPQPAENQQQGQIPYQLGAPMQLPGYAPGALVIPVTVPEVVTYNPPPVNMVVQRPAQLVIPPYHQPMMYPQQGPPHMMMPQQPQQPIPVKMIMPDGSVVSIKHYVPGKFWRNLGRAITP